MALATYTVQRGDYLIKICSGGCGANVAASITGSTVSEKLKNIVKYNNIKNPDIIHVGQVLKLNESSSSSGSSTDTTKPNVPVIDAFGLQAQDTTGRAMYVAWSCSLSNVKNYKVQWSYYADGQWFVTDHETTSEEAIYCNDTYSAPENASKVKVRVLAQPKTYTDSKGNEVEYFTNKPWSAEMIYDFSENPPYPPSVPTVEIKEDTLTASINNIDAVELNADSVEFEIVKDNVSSLGAYAAEINTVSNYVSYQHTIEPGSEYKVRARCKKGDKVSTWTDFSNNVATEPAKPDEIITCRANRYEDDTVSAYLEWTEVKNATSYEIQYTTNKNFFDGSDRVDSVTDIKFTHYEITSLELGKEYFFRVRAVNNQGESDWTEIKSVVVGTTPIAPTTWSSTTVAIVGEPLNLYWVHNSEDNSNETYAELRLYINDELQAPDITIRKEENTEDDTIAHHSSHQDLYSAVSSPTSHRHRNAS